MEYGMEELVPIVGKLAEKYTAHGSTSITYEKAEQLMGAVLYCIHELEEVSCNSMVSNEKIPASKAYELGLACVEEKTKQALNLYNRMIPEFCHYENQCLYDTFIKGIPEFFKWYDIQFEPENTIVSLDYPLLKDISEYTGIDRIFEFIKSICLEQKFLKLFPAGYITDILSKNNMNWKESMDNICETVLTYMIGHILAGKSLAELELDELNYYENDRELLHYLSSAIDDIVVRLRLQM